MKASFVLVLAVVFAFTQAIVVTQKASKYSGRMRKHRVMKKMTPEPSMSPMMPSMEPEPSYPAFTPGPWETDEPGITIIPMIPKPSVTLLPSPSMAMIPLPSLPIVPSPATSMKPIPSVPKLPPPPMSMMPASTMTEKPRYKKSMMKRSMDSEVIEWTEPIVLDMHTYWKKKGSDWSDSDD